jgi:hypothetical protein
MVTLGGCCTVVLSSVELHRLAGTIDREALADEIANQ